VNKLQGALQELEETGYWLELLIEAELVPAKRLQDLLQEAETLKAILVTIIRKVKQYPRDKGKK
jgi:four helix bundle protein